MGVPAFFRWLTRKYPSVVVECVEENTMDAQGEEIDVDSSQPNPNGVEFDNLYLDMNGIIHPCTHPEDRPAPTNEDEMMVAIFECIDRLFKIVRPRKVLYMAIDGVAPRAKMNQQRSRRFRAAKESIEKAEQIEKIRNDLLCKGVNLPPVKEKGPSFDSNCITPGTEFMARLTECLNYYIHERMASDPGWKNLKVILSDASVPGEGEHKIMDFVRRQRALPNHDPNTHHCLCGADADLIMLGLATHEPNFTIIREEFLMNQPKRCDICGRSGHELKDCKGLDDVSSEMPVNGMPVARTKYIFVRLNVLREYLEEELKMPNLPFPYSFERAVDDWVFMCFFVGNDFLPHLPSLEIREGAIDQLVTLYKKTVYRTGGFITDSGDVNLERVQIILTDLGELEDEIFRKRQKNELSFKLRNRQREAMTQDPNGPRKSYGELMAEIEAEEALDEVRLWESGYKDRYYKLKFGSDPWDKETRYKIGREYVRGLCWVLKYYYQGCVSWKWYFPYHYAPFASDIVDIGELKIIFEKRTQPFSPLEQLMGVFPAASGKLVPKPWAELMTDPISPILDFYPKDFMIDLNGKKYAWQGVALLPFVDEKRLRCGLTTVYNKLTDAEVKRNTRGNDRLYMNTGADCFDFVASIKIEKSEQFDIKCGGIVGGKIFVKSTKEYFQGTTVLSPIPGLAHVKSNRVLCVLFCDPSFPEDYKFMATRLEGAVDPPRTLKSGGNKGGPLIGFKPRTDRASLGGAGHRFLRHELPASHSYIPIGRPNEQNRPQRGGSGGGGGGGGRGGGFWAIGNRNSDNSRNRNDQPETGPIRRSGWQRGEGGQSNNGNQSYNRPQNYSRHYPAAEGPSNSQQERPGGPAFALQSKIQDFVQSVAKNYEVVDDRNYRPPNAGQHRQQGNYRGNFSGRPPRGRGGQSGGGFNSNNSRYRPYN